jgi:cold shock CspA family protein
MAAAEAVPLAISWRNITSSPAIEARIRREARKLGKLHLGIIDCRVQVAAPHRHQRTGKLYAVRLQILFPGGSLWINRGSALHHAHEDVYVAIRDAFAAANRRLEDKAGRRSGKVKHHEVEPHGIVSRLFPKQGYGFIRTLAGDEIYFHRNAVVNNGFTRLKEGVEVRFAAAEGESDKGPQATTVKMVGKHHLPPE